MVRCEMGNCLWLQTDMRASHIGLGSFHFTTKLHHTVWAKASKGVRRRSSFRAFGVRQIVPPQLFSFVPFTFLNAAIRGPIEVLHDTPL
jgi:hypothetical protein